MNKVIERVRKLLELAEHTPNEHEASNAASRAAQLIEQHQLDEATLRLDPTSTIKAEPIVHGVPVDPNKMLGKRVAWKETIAQAVANDLGLKMYYHGADPMVLGRESAAQTWQYTCQYLFRAVNELADLNWLRLSYQEMADTSIKGWKNGFRNGCARRLSVRIWVDKEEREKAARAAIDLVINGPSAATALTIIEQDQTEVDEAYENMSKGFGKALKSVGVVSNQAGYCAGKKAGAEISLGGKRTGLVAGQGALDD